MNGNTVAHLQREKFSIRLRVQCNTVDILCIARIQIYTERMIYKIELLRQFIICNVLKTLTYSNAARI